MAHQGKNRPAWKTDPNSFFHPNTHTAFLIVCPIVIAIAAGVFALCFSFTYDFLTAPYHIKTEARLDKITSGVTEKWEYIEGKDEARNPNQRATNTRSATRNPCSSGAATVKNTSAPTARG